MECTRRNRNADCKINRPPGNCEVCRKMPRLHIHDDIVGVMKPRKSLLCIFLGLLKAVQY